MAAAHSTMHIVSPRAGAWSTPQCSSSRWRSRSPRCAMRTPARTSGPTRRASSTTPTRCPPTRSTAPAPRSILRALRTSAPRLRSRPSRCAPSSATPKSSARHRAKRNPWSAGTMRSSRRTPRSRISISPAGARLRQSRARCSRRASTSRNSRSGSRICWRRRSPPEAKARRRPWSGSSRASSASSRTPTTSSRSRRAKAWPSPRATTPTSCAGASLSRWPRPSRHARR